MTYSDLLEALYRADYRRIERDDRLLDIFPKEDREKGIELWERWHADDVSLLRVRIPYEAATALLYRIKRAHLEGLLERNVVAELEVYPVVARGEDVAFEL